MRIGFSINFEIERSRPPEPQPPYEPGTDARSEHAGQYPENEVKIGFQA